MKILYYKTGEEPEIRNIKRDLKTMQQLVGGYIEVYPANDKVLIVCDEEGWCKGRPINRVVTDRQDVIHQAIRGDFFVCAEDGEDFKSLTDEQIQKIIKCSKPGRYPSWIQ